MGHKGRLPKIIRLRTEKHDHLGFSMRKLFTLIKECALQNPARDLGLLALILCVGFGLQGCLFTNDKKKPHTVNKTWSKMFDSRDIVESVCLTDDGGCIVAGGTGVRGGEPDAWVAKLDAGGNMEWQNGFGGLTEDKFAAVLQTSEGGFLAIGNTMTGTGASFGPHGLLVKLGPQGEVLWQKTLPRIVLTSGFQSSDGDLVLAGSSNAFGDPQYDPGQFALIVKTGPDGEIKWQKVYWEGRGRVIRQTPDGGYLLSGSVRTWGNYESRIIKVDQAGMVEWERQCRASINAIEPASEGGFLLAGGVNEAGWLMKIDDKGASQWQKSYPGVFKNEFIAVSRNGKGNIVVLGNTANYGAGNQDVWFLLLEENGTLIGQTVIGGREMERAKDVQPTAEGGYLIAAETGSFGPGVPGQRTLLLKVDKEGAIPGCSIPSFNRSNATAADIVVPFEAWPVQTQAMNAHTFVSSAGVPIFSPLVPAASFFPLEPKLVLSMRAIAIGPSVRKTPNRQQVRVKNIGGADLTVTAMHIKRSDQSFLGSLWASFLNEPGPVFSVTHTCQSLPPGKDCSAAVEFKSPIPGEFPAVLTIESNDPDEPVLTLPIKATVVPNENILPIL